MRKAIEVVAFVCLSMFAFAQKPSDIVLPGTGVALRCTGALNCTASGQIISMSATGGGSSTLQGLDGTEIAPSGTGVAGKDNIWPDINLHRVSMNNNNGGIFGLVGMAAVGTSGNCPKIATDGWDIIDSGAACGTAIGPGVSTLGDVAKFSGTDGLTLADAGGPIPANTTATSHNFFSAYTQSTGAFTKAQPACADISDAAATCNSAAIGGITGMGTGVSTFLVTPSSANLAGAITDETGSGLAVFATSPALTTPNIGVATATTVNKVTLTPPASGSTLTIADGKTLTANNSGTIAGGDAWSLAIAASKTFTVSNSLTLTGSDGTSWGFPSGNGTVVGVSNSQNLSGKTLTSPVLATLVTDTSIGSTTAAMTAQSSATCTNITGMTWAIAANKNYRLQCEIPRTLAASATMQYCLGGPGTATSYNLVVRGLNGASSAWSQVETGVQTAYGTKTTASTANANTATDQVVAFIQNGSTASGTALTLQTAGNGTNNITVGANAVCDLKQVN